MLYFFLVFSGKPPEICVGNVILSSLFLSSSAIAFLVKLFFKLIYFELDDVT